MKKLLLFVLTSLSVVGFAEEQKQWPQSFKVRCGDPSYKVPYDGEESNQLVDLVFEGQATRLPEDKVTGYYKGGVAYDIKGTLNEEQLLGTATPLDVTFSCYFKPDRDRDMFCGASISELSTVPGFNMMKAHLGLPEYIGSSMMNSSVNVRRSVTTQKPDSKSTRYYVFTREAICEYLN